MFKIHRICFLGAVIAGTIVGWYTLLPSFWREIRFVGVTVNDSSFRTHDVYNQVRHVSSYEMAQALCQYSLWEQCSIHWVGPFSVLIQVRPKEPVADWGSYYIDIAGQTFPKRGLVSDRKLPHIRGALHHRAHVNEVLSHQLKNLDTISVSDLGEVTCELDGHLIHVGAKNLSERIERIADILNSPDVIKKKNRYVIDLRYSNGFSIKKRNQ